MGGRVSVSEKIGLGCRGGLTAVRSERIAACVFVVVMVRAVVCVVDDRFYAVRAFVSAAAASVFVVEEVVFSTEAVHV